MSINASERLYNDEDYKRARDIISEAERRMKERKRLKDAKKPPRMTKILTEKEKQEAKNKKKTIYTTSLESRRKKNKKSYKNRKRRIQESIKNRRSDLKQQKDRKNCFFKIAFNDAKKVITTAKKDHAP